MRFLIDAQLPPALADQLHGVGHDANHVARLGLGGATDAAIWAEARARNAVLVSKDEDFVSLAIADLTGPQFVWVRLGNTTNAALWRAFEPALGELISALDQGDRVVEIT